MKNTKQLIKEAKMAISKKNESNQYNQSINTNNELNAFDLMYDFFKIQSPIQFTGMIEDYLFRQSDEIFNMLKQQTDEDIEGLTYNQIKQDQAKKNYHQKVISNIPKYYNLKPSDRQKHFQIEGKLYLQKMNVQNQQQLQQFHSPRKIKIQPRDPTPMKNIKISKKQALQNKKLSKKNNQINNQKLQLIYQDTQKKVLQQNNQNIYSTPQKRQKERKSVKFFQFQYVKDFSQYKTPKNLQSLQQYIEPLKQIQPTKKQQ